MIAGFSRLIAVSALAGLAWLSPPALAQSSSPNLAPGFTVRSAESKLLVMPADLELFSISAGGVSEPRADWTDAAQRHFRVALQARGGELGARLRELSERDLDDVAEIVALHRAVADTISLHHVMGGPWRLATKPGGLEWSLGDAVAALRQKSDADYALFFWVRDSYASGERKAAMIAMALFGVGLTGGFQTGYASLVDLRDGRVVWFNAINRPSGDLREPAGAAETLTALLRAFPKSK